MQPSSWERTQKLFFEAADLPPKAQARFLDSACGDDDILRAELESLLAADRKNGEGVASAVESAAAQFFGGDAPADSHDLAGRRLGPYRVVQEIGRGGMGAVYLATRDDDQYQKRVAIKVVKRGMDTAEVLGRFRHERQILANLEHPFIARLLDGGTTSDGLPFFVMEYVEGVPVDVFCRDRALSVKARLRLFLRICAAVAHAHRNLVVHRDLKPGNIFVTADGTPRLLDFGVAKLLTADSGHTAATATLLGFAFTPEYASPEQVRGLPVTTAADLYALGAILYELLTGVRAQPLKTTTPLEIDRVVCERLPKRPGLVAPGLDPDLDHIVLMALRKEPERRYSSVDAMAEDIRRYLDGLPVLAREGSFRYRAGKFMRRHRASIVAAVVLAAVLIGGAASSAIQAHRAALAQAAAEQQRARALASQRVAEQSAQEAQAQRANAEAERKRAESSRALADAERQIADRRFQQVRDLAGKFLLDFHDAVAPLPGSTPVRKMVVQTGLQYYDTLVREAAGDRALLEEIARGYDRLGDVQGNAYYANLGDPAGAMATYRKAQAIRDKIVDPSPEFLRDRIGGNLRIAEVLSLKGDVAAAERMFREMIAAGEQSPVASSRLVREALAHAYSDLSAMQFRTGAYDRALEPSAKLVELWTVMSRENRDPAAEKVGLSLGHARSADALLRLGRYDEALPHVRTAIAIDRALVEANPNNAPRLHKLYVDHSLLSLIFRNRPEMAADGEARQNAETTAGLADRMQAADPNNSSAFFDVMSAQSVLGDWFRDHGDAEASIPHYRRSLEAIERFAATRPGELLSNDSLAFAHQRLAAGFGNAGHLEEALDECRKADEAIARIEARSPGLEETAGRRANVLSTRADAYAHNKLWRPAAEGYIAAAAIFENFLRSSSKNVSYRDDVVELRVKMADAYAGMEQWSSAVNAMEQALSMLAQIASDGPLSTIDEEYRKSGTAKLALWKRQTHAAQ
jgi:tetratricopeptide (TPR) repeat protein